MVQALDTLSYKGGEFISGLASFPTSPSGSPPAHLLASEPRGAPVCSDTSPYASLPRHAEGSWVHATPAVGAIWESPIVQSISEARGEERVPDLAYLFLAFEILVIEISPGCN